MKFEPEWLEKELDKDYFGFEPSYINGEGVRKRKEEEIEGEPENNKILIIKGDDPEMGNLEELIIEFLGENDLPVEFEKAQKVLPEKAKEALKEAFGVLNKYKESLNKDLLEAVKVLGKYIGYGYPYPEPYPVKKELEKEPELFNWKSFIEHIDDDDIEEEIEKADPNDKFPSLTLGLLKGNRKMEREREKREIDLGRRFI